VTHKGPSTNEIVEKLPQENQLIIGANVIHDQTAVACKPALESRLYPRCLHTSFEEVLGINTAAKLLRRKVVRTSTWPKISLGPLRWYSGLGHQGTRQIAQVMRPRAEIRRQ